MDFEVLLNDVRADCLCLNEHWLVSGELHTVNIGNYRLASGFCRSVKSHGGVGIYIKNSLICELLNLEGLSVEQHCEITGILLKKCDVQLVTVYRTPDGDLNTFFGVLSDAFTKLDIKKSIILTGDFNVHFNEKDIRALKLCNFFRSFNLKKTVKFCTRGDRCLDNVFTNIDSTTFPFSSDPVDLTHTSDHRGVFFQCRVVCANPKIRICYRPITEDGLTNLYNNLLKYNFSFVNHGDLDMSLKFKMFIDAITNTINISMPEKSKLVKKGMSNKSIDWFNNDLREMRERLRFLISLNKRDQIAMPKVIIVEYKKKYRKAIKLAKIKANDDFINNSNNHQQAMWTLINNKNIKKSCVNINLNTNSFNNHFCSTAESIINNLESPQQSFEEYLKNVPHDNIPTFNFTPASFSDVDKAIQELKNSHSKDSDGINTKIIKTIKNIIIQPLTDLINQSMANGTFPKVFKTAKVVPLFKGKGSADDYNNYRPISLLPILSKVYERILKNQINKHFESNNLFSISQFGFRKNKTTTLAIDHFTSNISEGFEKYLDTLASFLDLTKAFDCVTHSILLKKLSFYKFHADAIQLLDSYLSDRDQYVHFNRCNSGRHELKYGVPQGSVLGPILFLIYINDLAYSQGDKVNTVLFADDTTLYQSYHPANVDNLDYHNTENNLSQWFLANQLSLNNSKSQVVNFTLRNSNVEHLYLSQSASEAKFLGVYLDSGLTWESHIVNLSKKLSKQLFLFRNLSQVTSRETLLTAYHSNFHSHLTYAILSWGHSCHTDKAFGQQRKCIRIISGLGYRQECRESFRELNILTLPCVYIMQCLLHVKQNTDLYRSHEDYHNYPTRNNTNLVPDFSRLERSRNGSRYFAVKFYNCIPANIKCLSFNQYKKIIKDYLILNAFFSFEEYFNSNFNL